MRSLILGLVALTSVLLLALARGQRRWQRVGAGIVVALETVGATVLLFGANVGLGAVLVLAGRRFTPFYFSLYDVSDVSLLLLSLLQALVLQGWRWSVRE